MKDKVETFIERRIQCQGVKYRERYEPADKEEFAPLILIRRTHAGKVTSSRRFKLVFCVSESDGHIKSRAAGGDAIEPFDVPEMRIALLQRHVWNYPKG